MVRQRGREEEREGETAHAQAVKREGDRKEKGTRENMLHAGAKPWRRRSSDHKRKRIPKRSGA